MRVHQPADLSGSSYLLVEKSDRDDTFMFLPAVNRVKRIQGAQMNDDLWGTDFSYEDIKQVQGVLADGKGERLADEDLGGKKAYVVSIVPAPTPAAEGAPAATPVYEKAVTWVAQENCVPLKAELYQNGKIAKRLQADPAKVLKQGQRWVPQEYLMSDLVNETKSELKVLKIEFDKNLPDRLFNPQTFYVGN
jgi:hypothetical protein